MIELLPSNTSGDKKAIKEKVISWPAVSSITTLDGSLSSDCCIITFVALAPIKKIAKILKFRWGSFFTTISRW